MKTKKILYAFIGLIILGAIAFGLSKSNLLKGALDSTPGDAIDGYVSSGIASPTPAGVYISFSITAVTEGGTTDAYSLLLNTQPTRDVTITLTPDAQITVSPDILTFTDTDWNVSQTVTVTPVDDTAVEGQHYGVITHTATSSDQAYNGISIVDVTAIITDNDTEAIKNEAHL